jgi:hypothetical protein
MSNEDIIQKVKDYLGRNEMAYDYLLQFKRVFITDINFFQIN